MSSWHSLSSRKYAANPVSLTLHLWWWTSGNGYRDCNSNYEKEILYFLSQSTQMYTLSWDQLASTDQVFRLHKYLQHIEEKVICYQLELDQKITCRCSTECSSRHQGKSEQMLLFIAMHYWQELLMKEAYTSRWHPQRNASTEMEDWKSLVAGLLW